MISVIIPYYNPDYSEFNELLLERAIRSTIQELKGTYPYQILIIDDGSAVSPKRIIDRFIDENIKLIKQEHGSLGAARNTGIGNASGDAILFLDADDYYFPHTLAPSVNRFYEVEADLLQFGFRKCYSFDMDESALIPHYSSLMTGNEYMLHHNLHGSSCRFVISKKLIDRHQLRFREGTVIEDEDFTTRMVFSANRLTTNRQQVYAYYQRLDSIINTSDIANIEKKAECTINMLKSLIEFRDLHDNEEHSGLNRKINSLAMDLIRRTLRRHDWKEALPRWLSELKKIHLYPFPSGFNSVGYHFYRLLSNRQIGLFILHLFESLYK